jgi:hypothetical protein
MLEEKYRQLLTGYVDGALSARQRRAVQKLLRKSPEARELLRHLQADSDALILLPAPPTVPDLSDSVIQTIVQRGLQPGRKPAAPRPPQGVPVWKAALAAAAVLLAVGTASYFFFTALSRDSRNNQVHRKKENPERKPSDDGKQQKTEDNGTVVKEPQKPPKKTPETDVVKKPDKKSEKPQPPVKKPEQPDPGPIFTAPSMEVFQPGSAEVAVPSLLKLRDLELPSGRRLLTQEMERSDAFYAEILCREATHAFPRLRAAVQAAGINLLVDHTAENYLRQPQFKANYCVFLEDVTPEEFAKLLQPLGVDDSKGDKKKPATGQFLSNDANLFLCAMTADHRRRLTALLGVDVRSKSGGSQSAEAAGKSGERLALALAYSPSPSKPPSPEIKHFLDGRKPAHKGTAQVMLVLRGRP